MTGRRCDSRRRPACYPDTDEGGDLSVQTQFERESRRTAAFQLASSDSSDSLPRLRLGDDEDCYGAALEQSAMLFRSLIAALTAVGV